MPASLVAPVFGHFSDFVSHSACAGWQAVSTADCEFVTELCELSITVYASEQKRQQTVQESFKEYIGEDCSPYNDFEGSGL